MIGVCFILIAANTAVPVFMLWTIFGIVPLIHHVCKNSCSTVCCPIAGCGAHLDCLEDFEDHYSTRHTASCSVCSRVYPTSRLLSIHISEAHDSFFEAKVAHGFPMYECLVEGCVVKLKTYKSRQQHLIDKHQFPKSFEFFKKAQPSQRHRQKYHWRYKGEETRDTLMDVDGKSPRQTKWRYRPKQHDHKESIENKHHHKEAKDNDMEVEQKMDELTSAVSKLSTADSTPSSITFGHRRSRGLTFVPRSIKQNKQVSQPEAKWRHLLPLSLLWQPDYLQVSFFVRTNILQGTSANWQALEHILLLLEARSMQTPRLLSRWRGGRLFQCQCVLVRVYRLNPWRTPLLQVNGPLLKAVLFLLYSEVGWMPRSWKFAVCLLQFLCSFWAVITFSFCELN